MWGYVLTAYAVGLALLAWAILRPFWLYYQLRKQHAREHFRYKNRDMEGLDESKN